MTLKEIISQVSKELNIPKDIVERTYHAYWRAVREHVKDLPLKEELTDEEFLKLQPNVNIPSIGKLNVTLDRYKKVKKMQEYKNKVKENKDATCN